jgi:hypothetical protein
MKILVLKRGIRREHCWSLLGNIVVSKADTATERETLSTDRALFFPPHTQARLDPMIGESTYRRMRRSSSSQTPYPLEKRAELDVPALGLDCGAMKRHG